jgi:probable F420-dependent oxidoreductase
VSPAYPLGHLGVWTRAADSLSHGQLSSFAAEIEALGWPALWIPETTGREAFTTCGLLLAATERLVVATGIASIWGRDPLTAAAAQKTLTEAYPERFVLGLGVSHAVIVEGARRQAYAKPFSAMRTYLEAMDSAPYRAVAPGTPLRRVIAALGPRMLRLSAERADGAHPYLTTPDHTHLARGVLGAGPILAPEQMVLLEDDATRARGIARHHLARYLALPNYRANLGRLGFADEDLDDGGTDRLVDSLVVWGDEGAVARRIAEHRDAGADHVCVQVLPPAGTDSTTDELRRLAAALL